MHRFHAGCRIIDDPVIIDMRNPIASGKNTERHNAIDMALREVEHLPADAVGIDRLFVAGSAQRECHFRD